MEKSAEMLIGTPVEIPVVPGDSERNTGKICGETLAANPKKNLRMEAWQKLLKKSRTKLLQTSSKK